MSRHLIGFFRILHDFKPVPVRIVSPHLVCAGRAFGNAGVKDDASGLQFLPGLVDILGCQGKMSVAKFAAVRGLMANLSFSLRKKLDKLSGSQLNIRVENAVGVLQGGFLHGGAVGAVPV